MVSKKPFKYVPGVWCGGPAGVHAAGVPHVVLERGRVAETWRGRWKSFCLWGLFCGALYYPLFGAWTWGGGWLSQLGNNLDLGNGYVDFAGSVIRVRGKGKKERLVFFGPDGDGGE